MNDKNFKTKKLTLLNAPIVTAYGDFRFEPLTLVEAKKMAQNALQIESAILHKPPLLRGPSTEHFPLMRNHAATVATVPRYPVHRALVAIAQMAGKQPTVRLFRHGTLEDKRTPGSYI